MNKHFLLGQLRTAKNNFSLTQVGILLMADSNAATRLQSSLKQIEDHPETNTFNYITYVFESNELLKHAVKELQNSALRNLLKETYEIVKKYCLSTNQMAAFKAAPWYQFLRIVRNCLSHDFNLILRDHELKLLPVSWSNLKIETTMINNPLPMKDFLSRSKAIELIDNVIDYTEKNIN